VLGSRKSGQGKSESCSGSLFELFSFLWLTLNLFAFLIVLESTKILLENIGYNIQALK
jgi:hypothetical protein